MLAERNKTVVKHISEMDYSGDAEKMMEQYREFYSPLFVGHNPFGDAGLDQFIENGLSIMNAFTDFESSLEDLIAEGDKVVERYSMSGIHTGDLFGVPGSGRRIKFDGVMIIRFEDGKIAETWNYMDYVGLMQQLGLPAKVR